MKIFYLLLLLLTFSYAQFDDLVYDMRSEEVLKIFDVEPEFLNNTYFIDVKNTILADRHQNCLLSKFKD